MRRWINLLLIVFIFFCYVTCSKKTENSNVDENVENVKSEETNFESNNINSENLGAKEEIILELINENYDYGNGNGTIIDQVILDNKRITTRKFEVVLELYAYDGWELLKEPKKSQLESLGDSYYNPNLAYQLPSYPIRTRLNFTLFRYEEKANQLRNEGWLYVTTDNGENGWLELGVIDDPFKNGNWSILETTTIQNKSWTVRKLNGSLLAKIGTNIKDNPSIDARDLFILSSKDNSSEVYIDVLAITEEKDTVEGKTDHWVKIKDEHNRIGWIFGGYLYMGDRGGAKYRIPADRIFAGLII
jgi:hypothetical protein